MDINPYMVDTYFQKMGKDLENMVGKPVFETNNRSNRLGKIIWYNKKRGIAKIRLFNEMYYEDLLSFVPLKFIEFPIKA